MKKMFSRICIAVVVLVSFLFVTILSSSTCVNAQEAFKPMTLKYGTFVIAASFMGQQHQWWAEQLEKRTGGKLKVQIFWMGSLVKVDNMLQGVQSGIVDLSSTAYTRYPSDFPLAPVVDMPGNHGDDYYPAVMAAMETMRSEPNVKAELEKAGVINVVPYSSGAVQIGTKKRYDSIQSLKGATIRCSGGAKVKLWESLGLNPVSMGYDSIYEALDRGTLDAAEITYTLSDPFKHQDVIKTVFVPRVGSLLASGICMNLKVYNGLPKEFQNIIQKLNEDAGVRYATDLGGLDSAIASRWAKENGVSIRYPSPEEDKAIREAAEKARESYFQRQEAAGNPARKVWDYYQKAYKKYEDQAAKMK
jgi:TRAP-type C4-dicarboxylate transport system substrate-binding protein